MFIRIKKNGGTSIKTVLACHNSRINGNHHQIIVKTFGHSRDESTLQNLFNEAQEWLSKNKDKWLSKHLPIKKTAMTDKKKISIYSLREEKRINIGISDIFGALYEELGFQSLLSTPHQETLRSVLMARMLEPGSKRRLSQVSEKSFDCELPLDRIYRMMDSLNSESDIIQKKIFAATKKANNKKVDLILFDVTTLSFESIEEDTLRAFGFSKDFRFNTTQITLALATTKEGLAVGYRLFPGNTAESKTLIESVKGWRKTFDIDNVTIVGDRAMMSESNISHLEEVGFKYVVACPLRKLSKHHKDQILNANKYCETNKDKEISRYQIIDLGDRKLCVSYSPKRAFKDAKDRERLVSKLKNKLATCKDVKRLLNKNGYLKYSNVSGQAQAHIDTDKIAEDARWDGLHGVISNEDDCDVGIFEKYRRLWVIEESFRINKNTLKMRPIYHFTPERIKAHILLCFMSFAMIRHIQYRLANTGNAMSVNRIIDALKDVQASILLDVLSENKYKMLSSLNDDAIIIYNVFNIQTSGLSILPLNL